MKPRSFLPAAAHAGYSLIEVLVAASVLLMAIGAAAVLSITPAQQEASTAAASVTINTHEQIARLFQLRLMDRRFSLSCRQIPQSQASQSPQTRMIWVAGGP